MKMRLMLFLLLAVPVCASTFLRGDNLVMGDIGLNATVVCEREQRTGFVHLQKELPCCIDADNNGYCNNDELRLGTGRKIGLHMTYWLPTPSFSPSFSHKLMIVPCKGTVFITGEEYHDFLINNGCERVGEISYCCDDNIFAQVTQPVVTGSFFRHVPSKKNPLLVVNKNRWDLVKAGKYKDKFIEKAIRVEKERCAMGGGDVFRWEQQIGGFFSDTKNYHKGERVFMFVKPEYDVIPLITWCD